MKWQVIGKKGKDIVKALLKNRGIRDEKNFFNPKEPKDITTTQFGINKNEIKKAIERIKKAKEKKEFVVIYGDYDADGICSTAILWETLYELGIDVLPYIPDRFTEGYGINYESVKQLKEKNENLKLVITVDNGIVAADAIEKIKELGVDVIVTDHHTKGNKKINPSAVVHTLKVSGSGVSWILSRELSGSKSLDKLELVAIGTIADQLPLLDENRSLVKYGLERLNKTKRVGLLSLFKEARIENVGTYEVGFLIAPRINAMGRLDHGINSLRLLCTNKVVNAEKISKEIGLINIQRQKIVDEVVGDARTKVTKEKVIVLASESYHEGVIGLAAGKIVEEFYRPAIVISVKGDISKASARSINGFNIIETIRKLEDLYLEGGGHPMAAGFSIETKKIKQFTKKINEISDSFLTGDLMEKKMKIDMEIDFNDITNKLYGEIEKFSPTGTGNHSPVFCARHVEVVGVRSVGNNSKHLKLKLRQMEKIFEAIYFGGGEHLKILKQGVQVDIAFNLNKNTWNGESSLQLNIKDIKV